ncbi:MAG TPA: SDR family oxidoreductase [Chloroflexota bacterium]|jgi:NAD(P)-dependent dehydrogenase (short-subunit alcohol dehydrogenase family)
MADFGDDFRGTVAVVTGGASGIGRATAQEFVRAGAHALLVDRDEPLARRTAAELGQATAVAADVSGEEGCGRAARAAADLGRPVKWLVNCAASFLSAAERATGRDWDTSLGVNVKGTALMAGAIAPLIRQAGGGAIVNVASISGWIAQPNRWTYNATKGAVLALTRCQALDLARDNIRVNSVSPGTIWTPELDRMTEGRRADWEPVFGPQHVLGRVGEPVEVASAILFLCSSAASFITGEDLRVDGGYLAQGHDRPEREIAYTGGETKPSD